MTVAELLRRWDWEEMTSTPGRFRLVHPGPQPPVAELLGADVPLRTVESVASPDLIVLAEFEDGGLISYKRGDGTWVHTLNTLARYRRRLWELGIEKPPRPPFWDESPER